MLSEKFAILNVMVALFRFKTRTMSLTSSHSGLLGTKNQRNRLKMSILTLTRERKPQKYDSIAFITDILNLI